MPGDFACELPSLSICPLEHYRLENRGVPEWMENYNGWFSLLLQSRDVWASLLFYLALAGLCRFCAEWKYPKKQRRISVKLAAGAAFIAESSPESSTDVGSDDVDQTSDAEVSGGKLRCVSHEDETAAMSNRCHHEAISRYFPSWVHACGAVMYSALAMVDTHRRASGVDVIDCYGYTQWQAMAHSFGYFIADMIMDRDPVYYSHHLGPLIYAEFMLRVGGSFYHAVMFGLICEAGNVICHTCAIYTKTMGITYPYVFAFTHFFSRAGSFIVAVLIVACDIPIGYGWVNAVAIICVLMIWGSNIIDFFRVQASASVGIGIIGKNGGGAMATSSISLSARKCFGFFAAAFRNFDRGEVAGAAVTGTASASASASLPGITSPKKLVSGGTKVFYGPRIVADPACKYN